MRHYRIDRSIASMYPFTRLRDRKTKTDLPKVPKGERGSCRAWLWFGRSLSLPAHMILLFWILLILLAISQFGGIARPAPYWAYGNILVVICLAILGAHALGVPR